MIGYNKKGRRKTEHLSEKREKNSQVYKCKVEEYGHSQQPAHDDQQRCGSRHL